jgi:hypothetical protein
MNRFSAGSLVVALAGLSMAVAGCHYHRRAVVETETVARPAPAPAPAPSPTTRADFTVTVTGTLPDITATPTPSPGVTILTPGCTAGISESCNGLDDNCDGAIDEGCGWSTGQIQVTLSWNTAADIDLYVYDPSGYRIYYADRSSPSGGMLDIDARGACVGGTGTIENIFWSTPTPPPGTYTVEVHNYAACGSYGPTPVQVSVSVGGRILGVYQLNLFENQRLPVTTFSL